MELPISIRLFVWGIIKRYYYWLPFVLLDIFDLWERYIQPCLSYLFGKDIGMPPTWIFIVIPVVWAGILTYHELRKAKVDAEHKIKDILDTKPSITVDCETERGYLQVCNNGEKAVFTAKAQRIDDDGEPMGDDWLIKWKGSGQIEQTIYKGDTQILEVASCEWLTKFGRYGFSSREPFIRFHSKESMTYKLDPRITLRENDLPPKVNKVKIEVKIFSSPSLLEPFQKIYSIKLVKEEDTVYIEEIA